MLAAQRFLLAVCCCLFLFTIVKHLPGNSMFFVYVALICSRPVGMHCAKMLIPIQDIRFKRIPYAVMPKNILMGAGGTRYVPVLALGIESTCAMICCHLVLAGGSAGRPPRSSRAGRASAARRRLLPSPRPRPRPIWTYWPVGYCKQALRITAVEARPAR